MLSTRLPPLRSILRDFIVFAGAFIKVDDPADSFDSCILLHFVLHKNILFSDIVFNSGF